MKQACELDKHPTAIVAPSNLAESMFRLARSYTGRREGLSRATTTLFSIEPRATWMTRAALWELYGVDDDEEDDDDGGSD